MSIRKGQKIHKWGLSDTCEKCGLKRKVGSLRQVHFGRTLYLYYRDQKWQEGSGDCKS